MREENARRGQLGRRNNGRKRVWLERVRVAKGELGLSGMKGEKEEFGRGRDAEKRDCVKCGGVIGCSSQRGDARGMRKFCKLHLTTEAMT